MTATDVADKGHARRVTRVILLVAVGVASGIGLRLLTGRPAPAPALPGPAETCVLTPIRRTTLDCEVPAACLGPVTNNSCRDWAGRSEACSLAARILQDKTGGADGSTGALLLRHASGLLGCWKPGAWPESGSSVTFDLKQYHTLEHLWFTTRIELNESVGRAWMRSDELVSSNSLRVDDAGLDRFAVEAFDGTRAAHGYPIKSGF